MRIKIWASVDTQFPERGPYKALDVLEKDALCLVGDLTHYGEVIAIPPSITPFSEGVDQSVIVKLIPASLNARPDESVFEKPPSSYDRIEFFPIHVDCRGDWTPNAPNGAYRILESENLTIEDVSHLITPDTFSVWKQDCFLSKDMTDALQGVGYAIAHRYSTQTNRDANLTRTQPRS